MTLMTFDVLLMKVLTTFYRRVYVFAKPVDPIPEVESDSAVYIRLLTEADVEAYGAQSQHHSAKVFCERLKAGHQCFAAISAGRVVHTGWAATGTPYVPYLNRRLRLREHEFYIHDTYTVPEYRNHGLIKMRNVFMQHYYRERGYTRSTGVVAVENKRAVQVAVDAQYTILGQLVCLRFGPLQWDWQRPFTAEPLPTLLPPT